MSRPDPGLPQQQDLRSVLRVVGPILVVFGLFFTITGMAGFFSGFGTVSGPPRGFGLAFVGIPLLGIGGAITKYAYLGPASRYVAGEVTPILRDTLGALRTSDESVVCGSCGEQNDTDSKFCDSCGNPLGRVCGSCGARNDSDALFCDLCGNSL